MIENVKAFLSKNRYYLYLASYVTIISVLLVYFIEFRYSGNSFLEASNLVWLQKSVFTIDCIIILMISLIFIGIVGNTILAQHILIATAIIIMFINEAKFHSRGAPLLPEDFLMTGNAGNLADMVDIGALTLNLLAALAVIIVGIFLSRWAKAHFKPAKLSLKLELSKRIAFLLVGMIGLYVVAIPIMSDGSNEQKVPYLNTTLINWNQELNYKVNTFIIGFIYNIRSSEMKEPDGYSQQKIEEIVNKYKTIAERNNANKKPLSEQDIDLVYVMNESFSDPTDLIADYPFTGGDPIPYTRSVMKSNSSGHVYSPMYGGGTADIEFEAMTGLSTYYLDMMPYPSSVARLTDFPSTAKILKGIGYQTTAIHPYEGSMYKRNFVYKNIGIDNFIDKSTIKFKDTVPSSQYISDESAYRQVKETLDSSDNDKFILLVTMQNHMPYDIKIKDPKFISSASYTSVTADEQTNYLADINYSDMALEKFIKEIDQRKKKTIVVLWGDHRPGIYNDLKNTPENHELRYQTPLLVYANFPVEKKDIGAISPNYLTNTVFDSVKAKLTPMQYMLKEIQTINPKLTKNNIANFKDSDIMHDYKLIEYDIISGKRYSQNLGFFEL